MSQSLRVRYESQEAFARAWEESLSRGVVFAHTDAPPRAQARVQVELELAFAGRKASLEGEVVHRVESGPGAGVAVELLAPLAALRAKLGPLAEGAGGAAKPAAGKSSDTPGPATGRATGAATRSATDAEAADEDALDLGDPVDDAAALEAAGLAEGDLDVSDDDLASVLGGGDEGAAPASAPAGVDATSSRTLAPLPPDPDDPYASLDPGALVLSEDDPEPTPEPEALPTDGLPFDPHERELD